MNTYSYLHPVRIGLTGLRLASILFIVLSAFAPASVVPGLVGSVGNVEAQGVTLPAEMNKFFTPDVVAAGQPSVLVIQIYNPNEFELTNASWTDNLTRLMPGLQVANPASISHTCGSSATVTAVPGSTTIRLTGGTVPAQVGLTTGTCAVTVNVTSFTTGAKVNEIPVGALQATGGGTTISNTDPAHATLNVTGASNPTISKSFNPSPMWAGGTSRLSINIRNNLASTALTQVRLSDSLPTNVLLANTVNPVLSGCGITPAPTLTADPGRAIVLLENGTILPSSTCTITVSVTSSEQGVYTNTIPAQTLETFEGLTNTSPATARLNVDKIGVSKRFNPPTISPGQTSILTITLQNPTALDYTGVDLTDNLPSPLIIAASPLPVNGCGGTLTADPDSASIVLNDGIIPAGSPTAPGTCVISVPVTVPAGTSTSTLTNRIPPGGLITGDGLGNPRQATANINISGNDLLASKSFIPNTITAGGTSRLRILVTAPLDTTLHNFSITDDLPDTVKISNPPAPSLSSGCGTTPAPVVSAPNEGGTISVTGATIEAGQQCMIEVTVRGTAAGAYDNIIPPGNITNTEGRRPAGNITSRLNVSGGTTLSIDLSKRFFPTLVRGGAVSSMSITLINPGTAPLSGIGFVDTMPASMVLADPVNFNAGTCGGSLLRGTAGSNEFEFGGGSLPPLGTCTLTLSATMTENGTLTNTIGAGALRTDQEVTNPRAVEASLTNLSGASVSKGFEPSFIAANAYSILTITIRNTSNIELVEMGVTDTLPEGLVIAGGSAPAPNNQCGGSLTAVSGTRLIELIDGGLAGNSACTIEVAITGIPGEYENTIPVGSLQADPGVRNTEPATATLTITGGSGGGGGGGGGGRPTSTTASTTAATQAFLIPVTGFAPGKVTQLDSAFRPAYASTGLMIDIPVLKLNTSIVGVESKNGNWDVSWLQNQAGWLNGTAYPTWNGNSVITGHVANADGKPGVFAKLKALGVGEYIYIYNAGYRYTYKVVSNEYVKPNDASVMRHEEKSYLTLITCDTYDEKTGSYLRRVAVRAVLVDVRLAQ